MEHLRGAARGLHHDGDSALLAVPVRDGDGDALALLIQAEDDKLTGLRVPGGQGRLDLEQADGLGVVEETLGYYLVHGNTSIHIIMDLRFFCCLSTTLLFYPAYEVKSTIFGQFAKMQLIIPSDPAAF